MKEKIVKWALWLIENNDELRAEAIRILADRDITVIANIGIHGKYYIPISGSSQFVEVNSMVIAPSEKLPESFLKVYR